MANSISINSEMTKLIFSTSSGTSELDLTDNGVTLKLANGDIGADSTVSTPPSGGVEVTTVNSQWTVMFNDTAKIVFFIGIDDIDVGISNPIVHQFDLAEKPINIRRSGTTLIAVPMT